jgi:hypothetical protein
MYREIRSESISETMVLTSFRISLDDNKMVWLFRLLHCERVSCLLCCFTHSVVLRNHKSCIYLKIRIGICNTCTYLLQAISVS